jgi:glycosyltransferase involved in cell wall biosynthesis
VPTISVITAAYAPSAHYIAETIASVAAQELPQGWSLQWVVQEDGVTPVLEKHFAGIPYVSYEASGQQLGIAATRNLALSRVTGSLVRVLDSDDVLLPNALATIVPRFEQNPIHWAVGQADDLMADGTRVPWKSDLPFGIVSAGAVNRWAAAHGGNWPIHCAGLTMRTDSLRAIGGLAGTPNDEDTVMFAALSEVTTGYNDEAVVWLYRQHPAQVTRTTTWRQQSEASRRIALQRLRAVQSVGLAFSAESGQGFRDTAAEVIHVGPAQKDHDKGEYL